MIVFVDVGAHEGQTLEEVDNGSYLFDRILALEPMPAQYAKLVAHGWSDRVTLFPFGLLDTTGTFNVYGNNDIMESSVYAEKRDADATVVTPCLFEQASLFLDHELGPDDVVVMKLNCEGAEVPILHDLVTTGAIHQLKEVMIDFDIRKVTGREGDEQVVLARMAEVGFRRWVLSEQVMIGATHQQRIGHWLVDWRRRSGL